MKNKIKCILLIALVIVILICVRYYIVNKTYSQLYLDKKNNLTVKNNDTKINDVALRGAGVELIYAIEDEVNWDNLPLTNSFKAKYKNGKTIMPEKTIYSMFGSGIDKDDNGNNCIVIFAEHKPDFFDFNENNSKTTIYYYKYFLSDDNKIDDIELVKKKTIDSTTGEIIIDK